MTEQSPSAASELAIARSRAAAHLDRSKPQVHALMLEEEFQLLQQGIGTLFSLAPDNCRVDANPYAVNFVAHALESIGERMSEHFKQLRQTLDIRDGEGGRT
jgi:hypothetical protein